MRWLLITLGCLIGCGGPQVASSSESVSTNVSPTESPVHPAPQNYAPSLVDDEGTVLGGYPDGAVTLVGLETRCIGSVASGHIDGCALELVRVALPGDAIATLLAPQSNEPPALAVDAPFRGEFPGHALHFVIESAAGDALCPGSPTLIRFFEGDALIGEVSLNAPITRQLRQGVVALLVTPDEAFVLLRWGRDNWRLVTTRGDAVSEGHFAEAECDCCE